jgi:Protein of unknown function (DUF3617)
MQKIILAALLGTTACLAQSALAQTGLDLKGKMKEGQYETTFKMEIPGLPPGVGGFSNTAKSCMTKEDIEKGKGEMFRDPKNGQKDTSCEVKNVKSSGNTVTYDVVCPKEGMTMNTALAFNGDSVKGLTKMNMTGDRAKNMPPGMANMQMQFESKYLGPTCSK